MVRGRVAMEIAATEETGAAIAAAGSAAGAEAKTVVPAGSAGAIVEVEGNRAVEVADQSVEAGVAERLVPPGKSFLKKRPLRWPTPRVPRREKSAQSVNLSLARWSE